MRIVEYLALPKDVEFVNVDSEKDVGLFCQPAMIRWQAAEGSPLAVEGVKYIDSFDKHWFGLARSVNPTDMEEVKGLFQHFNEVHECGLGMAKSGNSGKGSSLYLGDNMYEALSVDFRAQVEVGVLNRLEALAPLTKGVARDRVSDMTTRLVIPVLVEFTEKMRKKYRKLGELPVVTKKLEVWDIAQCRWVEKSFDLIDFQGRLVLLMPKLWTWGSLCFSRSSFYGVTIVGKIQERSLANSGGKEIKKSKKKLKEEYPYSPELITKEIIKAFQEEKENLIEMHGKYVDFEYLPRELNKRGRDAWNK